MGAFECPFFLPQSRSLEKRRIGGAFVIEKRQFSRENTLEAVDMADYEQFKAVVCYLVENLNKITSQAVNDRDFIEELVLEHDDWYTQLKIAFSNDLTLRQTACFSAFDSYIDKISGQENEELWTNEAFFERPEWKDVREIAALVILSFSTDPPRDDTWQIHG